MGLVAGHPSGTSILRVAPDAITLATEIAVTLWHELAHKLGFDEAGVDELGLA